MADLNDLDIRSITDMGNDEALELLRQIRLSRCTPVKAVQSKVYTKKSVAPKVDPNQAAELLKLIQGGI